LEDILGYIIIFGLLIAFTWIYFSKKEKRKEFSLTNKKYSFGSIDLLVRKKASEIECLLLKINPASSNAEIVLDLIKSNRTVDSLLIPPDLIVEENTENYCILFDELKMFLKDKTGTFDSFRFVVINKNSHKLKTGIIAFNKRYSVFVPDTGFYN